MYVDVVSLLQSNTQDQILLQWEGGDSATMHVLVVHAMIILLTYGPPNGKCIQEMIAVIEEKVHWMATDDCFDLITFWFKHFMISHIDI